MGNVVSLNRAKTDECTWLRDDTRMRIKRFLLTVDQLRTAIGAGSIDDLIDEVEATATDPHYEDHKKTYALMKALSCAADVIEQFREHHEVDLVISVSSGESSCGYHNGAPKPRAGNFGVRFSDSPKTGPWTPCRMLTWIEGPDAETEFEPVDIGAPVAIVPSKPGH